MVPYNEKADLIIREANIKKLHALIQEGEFNWEYGDEWYTEHWVCYSLGKEAKNLEDTLVQYSFSESSRNWQGDDLWYGEQGDGEATLGTVMDFIMNRKFGNKDAELSFKEIKDEFNTLPVDELFNVQSTDDYEED